MTVEQFESITAGIPYVPRGMFFSELYLFTVHCLQAGVLHVIESGVGNGLSTRVLRELWPGHLQSIERKRVPWDLQADVIHGDGRELVPALVDDCAAAPVAVLLDGPKGPKGDALRAVCWTYPHVRVVAQHDSPPGHGETIHSTDRGFRHDIGEALDARIPSDVRGRYPNGCPGLGIWVRA